MNRQYAMDNIGKDAFTAIIVLSFLVHQQVFTDPREHFDVVFDHAIHDLNAAAGPRGDGHLDSGSQWRWTLRIIPFPEDPLRGLSDAGARSRQYRLHPRFRRHCRGSHGASPCAAAAAGVHASPGRDRDTWLRPKFRIRVISGINRRNSHENCCLIFQ
ncbi:MAG: hypothetical protein OXL68_14290 [Paracoccaceae bacterium]|nr:hypothetical protein [Paracoccaceae bacterium]